MGGNGEELGTVVPMHPPLIDQLEKHVVNQRRGWH